MHKTSLTIPCKGYEIAADWHAYASSDKILLVLVGYGSNKGRHAELVADMAQRAGVNALVLDLSGHGDSPFDLDDITPAQHVLEVVTAFDWLRAKYPASDILVMGTSYGGYMAAWLSRFRTYTSLILRTPAIYEPTDFYTPHAHIEKAEQLAVYRSDKSQVLQNPLFLHDRVFKGATLLVVHEHDEDIPPATSDAYKDNYRAAVYMARGFRHAFRDPQNPPEGVEAYKQALVSWIKG